MSISLKYTELGLTKKGEKLILEENQYTYQDDTWTMIKQFMIVPEDADCCDGKHCSVQFGLKKGYGFNKYASRTPEDPHIQLMDFCRYCFNNYVYDNCTHCSIELPITELIYPEYTTYKVQYCRPCILMDYEY